MSYKSILQIFILALILIILFSVYLLYFSNPKELLSYKDNNQSKINTLDSDQNDNNKLIMQDEGQVSENKILNEDKKIKKAKIINQNTGKQELEEDSLKKELIEKTEKQAEDNNLLTEVEYVTTDDRGNKYQIFAKSAKTNEANKDVLNLNEVRGIITSDYRSTIYIVSDFAKYNSVDLNSEFYNNVVINFEEKQIDCDTFTMDMDTNLAEAYGNVVVTDPKSIMYAGVITLDIKTKDININPEQQKKIKVVTE